MKRWICPVTSLVVFSLGVLFAPTPGRAATLAEQTLVKVKLLQPLKSGHERKGDQIRFEVVDDVKAADQTVLVPKGTPVIGTVTRSSGRGMFGKPGKLEYSIDYIKAGDQIRVPLRCTPTSVRGRNNAAAAITTAVLLAPIAIFVKGREVSVKEGTEYVVYVDQTTEITASGATGTATAPSKYEAQRLSSIRLKNGDTVVGTICGFKDGTYLIATEVAQMSISQDQIVSITEKK